MHRLLLSDKGIWGISEEVAFVNCSFPNSGGYKGVAFAYLFFDGVSCLPLLKVAGEELARYFGGRIIQKRFNKQSRC